MKILAALFLFFVACSAGAQVRCEPAPFGAGTYPEVQNVDGVGDWMVHFCRTPCAWEPQYSVKANDYSLKMPDASAGLNARQWFQNFHTLNATLPLDDPAIKPLSDRARSWSYIHEPMPPSCVIGPSAATDGMRPTYYLDDRGNVGHLSGKRVKSGVECLCHAGQRHIGTDGRSTYCAFKGGELEPLVEVAVCRPVQ